MKRLRLLFKIGFVYHKAAFDPVIELFQRDDRYDVFFALDEGVSDGSSSTSATVRRSWINGSARAIASPGRRVASIL
jgi:hypothetical protein